MKYWLIKSEEEEYSIADLRKNRWVDWYGVRNYQARNFMRDEMKIGDLAIYYHSNGKPSGAVGIARVCSESHPDKTAHTPTSQYYDKRSTKSNPIWECVDFEFVEEFTRKVSLSEIKQDKKLEGILVAQKGSRLSITPLSKNHFMRIKELGGHL